MPQAIREMPIWQDAPFAEQVPKGLTIRRGTGADGRELVVISNQAHKAFSFPISLMENNKLPDFYLDRLKTL